MKGNIPGSFGGFPALGTPPATGGGGARRHHHHHHRGAAGAGDESGERLVAGAGAGSGAEGGGGEQELVGGGGEKRNWKGMAIAILVILIVCGFVVLAVVLSAEEERKINLVETDDIWSRRWEEGLVKSVTWSHQDALMWLDRLNHVIRRDSSTGRSTVLIKNQTLVDHFGVTQVELSSNGRLALFIYNAVRRNSHSFDASYTVYNIESNDSNQLLHKGESSTFEFANFGPKGQDLIYVHDGNLYYVEDVENNVHSSHQVTNNSDGVVSAIPDWLYEEEIFKRREAHWWSEEGSHLAFAEFDDRQVDQSFVTRYLQSDQKSSGRIRLNVYPKRDSYSCPKAGRPQPIVRVKVFSKVSKQVTTLTPPKRSEMSLLQSVAWSRATDDYVLVTWSERTQRRAMTQACNVTTGECVDGVLQVRDNRRTGWIPNLARQPPVSAAGKVFFALMPWPQGNNGYFRHIVSVDFTRGTPQRRQLTSGVFDVTGIAHYNATTRSLYFTSKERNRTEEHLYHLRVGGEGGGKPTRTCLTCRDKLKGCKFYQVVAFHKDQVVLNCLGPRVPASFLGRINGKEWIDLDPDTGYKMLSKPLDDEVNERLSSDNFEFTIKYLTLQRANRDIIAQLIMPNDVEPGKFGIVVEISSELGSSSVNHKYGLTFLEYLTSRFNVYSLRIDGAGSGEGGERILHAGLDDPKTQIIEDVRQVLRYMDEVLKLSIGPAILIGRGFGGYVSIQSLLDESDLLFPCAVALSPIVDWEAHTSVVSERMFGNFTENLRKYEENNLLKSSLKDMKDTTEKRLLVFHGLTDKRCHHQHTMALTSAAPRPLVEAVFYAGQDHVTWTRAEHVDFFNKSREFVLRCIKRSPLIN